MTEVLQSPGSHFSSSSSSIDTDITPEREIRNHEGEGGDDVLKRKKRVREGDHLSILALLVAALRRSIVGCRITVSGAKGLCGMEIGVPTNVRHVAHVTFDRFNGFLGLPVEFEPEVPRRAPSASTTVFGVSTESMQLSYDSRGNSVPTILLMMQRHLYAQGGLQVEGIFRITAGNSQEEFVRDQLNRGVIPEGIDVHCLAGLIKTWFRELPTAVLDSLSPEQVMQSQSEEECAQLVRLLPLTEAALLDWAINLMADVAQLEHTNKMNARNIAMVFAPNMTKMSDPFTALMYAVQVMNFLKNLIIRTLREREECIFESTSQLKPGEDNGDMNSSESTYQKLSEESSDENEEKIFCSQEPAVESPLIANQDDLPTGSKTQSFASYLDSILGSGWSLDLNCPCEVVSQINAQEEGHREDFLHKRAGDVQTKTCKNQASEKTTTEATRHLETSKGTGLVVRVSPRTEMFEAWR